MQGTWKMSVMGIDGGQMIITSDSVTIYPSVTTAVLSGDAKPATSKVKWKESGNQITSIDETGGKLTFTVLDKDHLSLKSPDGDELFTREK